MSADNKPAQLLSEWMAFSGDWQEWGRELAEGQRYTSQDLGVAIAVWAIQAGRELAKSPPATEASRLLLSAARDTSYGLALRGEDLC